MKKYSQCMIKGCESHRFVGEIVCDMHKRVLLESIPGGKTSLEIYTEVPV